jgi:succinate dehydrogenase/fumarate reductase flavoprotein subunit
LELLAKKIGVNPEAFVESTKSKFSNLRGPFYALGPVRSYVTITEGGLSVNESFQVLNEADQVIPGLFAAGSNGQGGLLLEGHGHHIAWAFVSGRLAGESIGSLRS